MWIYSLLLLQGLLNIWYARLFNAYTQAWKSHRVADKNESAAVLDEVCILIALRNEEKNLPLLFNSLEKQSYTHFQVLFIDDHSEDASGDLITAYCQSHPYARSLVLPNGTTGKKQALSFAMAQVQSTWILCTDADTSMGPDWVLSMMHCACKRKAVFVSGPVSMNEDGSWFSRWQALEFSGLIAIGAAGIFMDRPTMCNGANLLYRREAFIRVGGFGGNEKIASGDDQFLMHRIHEWYPGGIQFCMDKRAIVCTGTLNSKKQFVQQRLRWASKNGQFERKAVSTEMLGVWLVPVFLLLDIAVGFYDPLFFVAFIIFFFIKLLFERHFYKHVLPFFRQSALIKNFWLSEILHVVYVVGIGLLGKFVSYEWKGRKHARWN
ncbi:MAG: glycosyltransferase [Bacteroidia bacterium]